MNSSTISAIVIAVELALRAVCVYAILRVTLTMFSIWKAEKIEKERDAALTWFPHLCSSCAHNDDCRHKDSPVLYPQCPWWQFCAKKHGEVFDDDDGRDS